MSLAPAWSGCHGVRVVADLDLEVGSCRGEPLVEATVVAGTVPPHEGPRLWEITAGDDNGRERTQSLYIEDAGRYILELGDEHRIAISKADRQITVPPPIDPIRTQLVVSFGFPLLIDGPSRLVVHGAAAVRDERAVLVAGTGGTGKSSSLVGLIEAGWSAISEDVCVIDLGQPRPVVWPGPPWVRLHHGEPGPGGARIRFSTSEKSAWDLSPWQSRQAVPLTAIVVLEPPGGLSPHWVSLERGAAVSALAAHSVWLGDQTERGRRLFGPVAAAVSRIPVARLRLPVSPAWLDDLIVELDREVPGPSGPAPQAQ